MNQERWSRLSGFGYMDPTVWKRSMNVWDGAKGAPGGGGGIPVASSLHGTETLVYGVGELARACWPRYGWFSPLAVRTALHYCVWDRIGWEGGKVVFTTVYVCIPYPPLEGAMRRGRAGPSAWDLDPFGRFFRLSSPGPPRLDACPPKFTHNGMAWCMPNSGKLAQNGTTWRHAQSHNKCRRPGNSADPPGCTTLY